MAEITLDKKIEMIKEKGYSEASYPTKLAEHFLSLPVAECMYGLPVTYAVFKRDFPQLEHASMLEACAELRRMKIRHDEKYHSLLKLLHFVMRIKGELSDDHKNMWGERTKPRVNIALEEVQTYSTEASSSIGKTSAAAQIASMDKFLEADSVIRRFMHLRQGWMKLYLELRGADMYQADELWGKGYKNDLYLYETFNDVSIPAIEFGFLMPVGSLTVKEDAYAEEKAKRREAMEEREKYLASLSPEERRNEEENQKLLRQLYGRDDEDDYAGCEPLDPDIASNRTCRRRQFRRNTQRTSVYPPSSSRVQKPASSKMAANFDVFLLLSIWITGISLMLQQGYGLLAVFMVVLANVFLLLAYASSSAGKFFAIFNGILAGVFSFALFRYGISRQAYWNGILVLAMPAAFYALMSYASIHHWKERKTAEASCFIMLGLTVSSFYAGMIPCGIILCILLFLQLCSLAPDKDKKEVSADYMQ